MATVVGRWLAVKRLHRPASCTHDPGLGLPPDSLTYTSYIFLPTYRHINNKKIHMMYTDRAKEGPNQESNQGPRPYSESLLNSRA
jgi:hypothetical protein